VKTELTSWIQNNQTLWTQGTNSHGNANKWEQQRYQEQLKALEEKLTDKLLSEKSYKYSGRRTTLDQGASEHYNQHRLGGRSINSSLDREPLRTK
jgi:hypothetical protein